MQGCVLLQSHDEEHVPTMAPPLPAPAWVAKLYSNSELLTTTAAPVTEMPPPFWAVLLMKVVPTTVVVTAAGSVAVEMPWLLVITIAPPSPPGACADRLPQRHVGYRSQHPRGQIGQLSVPSRGHAMACMHWPSTAAFVQGQLSDRKAHHAAGKVAVANDGGSRVDQDCRPRACRARAAR